MSSVEDVETIYDVLIIGGGIIGCAVLRELTLRGYRCILCEKNYQVVSGASCGNSGILHTGFDVTDRSSIEFKLVKKGFTHFQALVDRSKLPVRRCGALMLAWNEEEFKKLPDIVKQSHDNGVLDVKMLSREQILELEPHIDSNVLGGVIIPGETAVDPWVTPVFYLHHALRNGASLKRNCMIVSGKLETIQNRKVWRLTNQHHQDLFARVVVNCAGNYGDIVERIHTKPHFNMKPRKGQFLVFRTSAPSPLLNHILLPIPTERTKGVLVAKTVHGNVLIGPTAEDQPERDAAPLDPEIQEMLLQKGLQVIPELAAFKNQVISYTGVRPATQYKDYQLGADPDRQWITVAGVRSTGLTASLAIGKYVYNMMESKMAPACVPQRCALSHGQEDKVVEDILKAIKGAKKIPSGSYQVELDGVCHEITHPVLKIALLDKMHSTSKL